MDKNMKMVLLLGGAATALAIVMLGRGNGGNTVVANPANPVTAPTVSIPPLDLSGLGTLGGVPWTPTTGINFPPFVGSGDDKGCCNECKPHDAASATTAIINAFSLGPPQPYVDTDMLTPLEKAAVDLGVGQIVYDPSSERGFFVASLSNTYAGTTRAGAVYSGVYPTLPAVPDATLITQVQ